MNITVVRQDGTFTTRPDTTLERESLDFYLPDGFTAARVRGCTFIRIIKAGKAVSTKFAERYFDSFGRGWLLECLTPEGESVDLVDGSSFLPQEMQPSSLLPQEQTETVKTAISRISRWVSVRIGDIIAFEDAVAAEAGRGGNAGPISIL